MLSDFRGSGDDLDASGSILQKGLFPDSAGIHVTRQDVQADVVVASYDPEMLLGKRHPRPYEHVPGKNIAHRGITTARSEALAGQIFD